MVTAPAFCASATVANVPATEPCFIITNRFEKSTLPSNRPIGGMIISATTDLTMEPKAAPMIMPTAISTTFPLIANSLNSLNIFLLLSLLKSTFHICTLALIRLKKDRCQKFFKVQYNSNYIFDLVVAVVD